MADTVDRKSLIDWSVRNGSRPMVTDFDKGWVACAQQLAEHIENGIFNPNETGEKAEFGTFAAHQPGYDRFKDMGVLDDYVYQALVHMGNASHQWSWANTVLERVPHVPTDLKERIRAISGLLYPLKDELRRYRKEVPDDEHDNR